MPRQYKRKTENGMFQADFLARAVNQVLNGEPALVIAKNTGIPRTTLRRKVAQLKANETADIATNFTKSQVFTTDQEADLESYLRECSRMFYGLTTNSTRKLAYETAVINKLKYPSTWDDNQCAGLEWLKGFMRRHPNLSIRTPEATFLARATAFNRHNIKLFFYIVEERILSLNVQARQIFNLDESGFTTVQGMPKVITTKGVKQVGQMTSRERGELVTVCAIVSGTGVALPPAFVFPRKRLQPHMLNNAPEGSLGLVSDSGWMTAEKFLPVLEHFVNHVQPSEANPVILILDNHESHLSVRAIEYAKRNHVHMITLVPHTSNKTQPLDRTVFGPVKKFYNDAAVSWMMKNPGQTISIYNVAELVKEAWLRGATPVNIISGFRAGLLDPILLFVHYHYHILKVPINDTFYNVTFSVVLMFCVGYQ